MYHSFIKKRLKNVKDELNDELLTINIAAEFSDFRTEYHNKLWDEMVYEQNFNTLFVL